MTTIKFNLKTPLITASVLAALAVSGCDNSSSNLEPNVSEHKNINADNPSLLSISEIENVEGSQSAAFSDGWLLTSETKGLMFKDSQQNNLQQIISGEFKLLAVNDDLALTLDVFSDRVQPINLGTHPFKVYPQLPPRSFEVNWLCLQSRIQDNSTYAWIGSETGIAEQWLLNKGETWKPQLVRQLSVPVGSLGCAIDNENEHLYVVEQQAGIWQYEAHPESEAKTKLAEAYIDNKITSIQFINGKLVHQTENGQLFLQKQLIADNKAVEAEHFSIEVKPEGFKFISFDDEAKKYIFSQWSNSSLVSEYDTKNIPLNLTNKIKEIPAWVESEPSDRAGDTMDDPAIWLHPDSPEKSLILGTNKRWGLVVFNMNGKQIQSIPTGRINNIDIRQNLPINGTNKSIAVASLRDGDKLAFYEISDNGMVTEIAQLDTELKDIYGTCLYQDKRSLYVFANEKSGRTIQYRVNWNAQKPKLKQVRQLMIPSQVEGCVANDDTHQLFIGEEDKGIWLFNAIDTATSAGELIIKAGDALVADVEGLALYRDDNETLLIASSQGNDSYMVYDTKPPFSVRGNFRIGANIDKDIDGSSETDGLAVTSSPVGDGAWGKGMIVVQDGRNRMPDSYQSFKWLPWAKIKNTNN
ncbi:phytase [Parashewanella spongiae]|uniref:Phytase n=1 Tax=Parashewanella spongiae TaxID=342950 RepID=A0A3A6UB74_9GAMM|nr:phytase [Parashewanella spongiae]MCL1076869.1 phytase [Parashewanella spongiae]RJY19236.1 phytase [Parashewanella spongiae]